MLAPDSEIETSPVFTTPANRLIPDPAIYSDWFDDADEERRRMAVGTRRYTTMAEIVGEPEWVHFVDPDTGRLLTLAELRAETPEQREERVARVREIMAANREAIAGVATFGFVPGRPVYAA